MKRALVLGTSHSVASCSPKRNVKKTTTLFKGRWHDYLKTELGYEVDVLARSGVSTGGMFYALSNYLADNPEKTWDLILIEGRSIEATFDYPVTSQSHVDANNYIHAYHRFFPKNVESHEYEPYPFKCGSVYAYASYKEFQHQIPYLVDYAQHPVHLNNVLAHNLAMCHLASTRSPVVKFFVQSHVKHFFQKWDHYRELTYTTMGEFMLRGDKWAQNMILPDPEENYTCGCGHCNEKGHEYIWRMYILPELLKIDKLAK